MEHRLVGVFTAWSIGTVTESLISVWKSHLPERGSYSRNEIDEILQKGTHQGEKKKFVKSTTASES